MKHVRMLEGETTVETDREREREVSAGSTVCAYLFIGDLLVTGE